MKNKKTIREDIKALERAVEMEKDIRETVEEFKKYKKVDKRFTDALKKKGYSAYIFKECDRKKFKVVYLDEDIDYEYRREFYIYRTDNLTWDLILSELDRYEYEKQLQSYKNKLEKFDEEHKKLSKLNEILSECEFSCFDLYRVKLEVNNLLEFAKNGENK